MAIIKFLLRYRPVRNWTLIAATSLALVSLGFKYDLNKSEWSGWAQAIGAFAAILASGWLASSQSRRQFDGARRLQELDRARAAFHAAKATTAIATRIGIAMLYVMRQFNWEADVIHDIGDGRRRFDRGLLAEMLADLNAIPMHELPSSRLVDELLHMRSAIRQVTDNIYEAFDTHRQMNAGNFESFFNMLDDAHLRICQHIIRIESITNGLRDEIRRA